MGPVTVVGMQEFVEGAGEAGVALISLGTMAQFGAALTPPDL